jgi:hypothetical protein
MAVTRLSDSQKAELVVRFRAGEGSQALASAYGCSAATITRTVRAALDPAEYERLKQSGGRRSGAPSSGEAPSPEALAPTHTQSELAYPQSELAFPESKPSAREFPLPTSDPEAASCAQEADLSEPAPGVLALADADDFAIDNFANDTFANDTFANDDEDVPGEVEDESDKIVEAIDLIVAVDGDDDDLSSEADDLDDDDDEFADIDDEDEDELSDEEDDLDDDDPGDDDSDDEEADIGVIRPRGTRRHHAADALAALGTAARTGQPVETRPLEEASLPASAYMLVDKTVELQARPLSEFPELGLLEAEELERQALVVFGNPRQAKRQCGRSQRVIKIPDTSVFVRTSRFLVSQGISRVVIEGALYSLPGS